MKEHVIKIKDFSIANSKPLVLIAGPCQIESVDMAFNTAYELKNITEKLGIGFIYKSSFDKANRTSIDGKRGIGLDSAMDIFSKIKQQVGCPILTDVHNEAQCEIVSQFVDVLQIPAFLCRQTDMLIAAGKTNAVVNIKKGQFMAPWDIENAAVKVASTGNNNIMLTERGVSFGYNRLVNDMRALHIMAQTGYPVVFDATHSVQEPSGRGGESGGQRQYVELLARAAVAATPIAALFVETHPDPDNAHSDGPCMVELHKMKDMMYRILELDKLVKNFA